MRRKAYQTMTVVAATMMILSVAFAPVVLADNMEGGEYANRLPMKKVTITKKNIEAVMTNIGDRYRIGDETIITGLEGQQVSIRKMLVPCEAEITYEETEKGVRIAERIRVVRIDSDAKWQWEAEASE